MKSAFSLNCVSEPVTPVTLPLIMLEQFYFQIFSYFPLCLLLCNGVSLLVMTGIHSIFS